MPHPTRCKVDNQIYVFHPIKPRKGQPQCHGCAAWDARALEMLPLCDQLPECEGGIWRRQEKQQRKGSQIVPIRIPTEILARIDTLAAERKLTRSALIIAAIKAHCNTPMETKTSTGITPKERT